MAVFVIPVVIGGEKALEALIIGGAALWALWMTQQQLSESKPAEPQVQCCCPACVPPVGTLMWEIHRVPPSSPHFPCPGDHVHWFRMQQNPNNCQCFKQRNALPVQCIDVPGSTPQFPPGTEPLPAS